MPDELLIRRAPLTASSWNPDERTLEVIFSTGAGVERMDARGTFLERLDLDQDWSAFIGAPVLNAHKRGDVRRARSCREGVDRERLRGPRHH
ncbi:hypothetical protein [Ancylobacter oerskovii]|uniref:Uncharacterized protein n=1 Tax=Ancylobacter oerskovii TaxID=459519 RepID=A0ABW4YR63_9HYPH